VNSLGRNDFVPDSFSAMSTQSSIQKARIEKRIFLSRKSLFCFYFLSGELLIHSVHHGAVNKKQSLNRQLELLWKGSVAAAVKRLISSAIWFSNVCFHHYDPMV
jgi:hypothetical protein